jgi:hypothetical protein
MLTREQIEAALSRLGELALARGQTIELLVIGGVALMLTGDLSRLSTHDVDAVILAPANVEGVRALAAQVALEQGLEHDWLNDAAKGYLVGTVEPVVAWETAGVRVLVPATAHLLALKLSAWRDIQDQQDVRFLLRQLAQEQGYVDEGQFWTLIEPHLVPGRELRARYAFLDTMAQEFGG